jgi:hypothetical protein
MNTTKVLLPIDNGNGTITILSRFDNHFFPICLEKGTLQILTYEAEIPDGMLEEFEVTESELLEEDYLFAYKDDLIYSNAIPVKMGIEKKHSKWTNGETCIDNESWIVLYGVKFICNKNDKEFFYIHNHKRIGYNYDFPKLDKYRKFDFPVVSITLC